MMRGERTPLIQSAAVASTSDGAHISDSMVSKSIVDLQTGVSWGVAAFLLVNTALGAGMLNYPYAYNQIGGVLPAALMQIVLLVFITSTMFILVYCADFNQDDSYHDVLLSMCGKRAQQISALSILLTCYGINITFLVIIGDQYDRIFNSLLSEYLNECWFLDRKFTISLTAVLFIWPMCYARRLDFLRHASILGMFAMLYVAFLTVYEHYKLDEATLAANQAITTTSTTSNTTTNHHTPTKPHVTTHNHTVLHKSLQWFEPLATVPILCFAYQTHEVIVPVYACMKQRSISHFMKASIFGLIILFFLYNLVGAYGYLTFGANVGPDIMSLYDAKDPVVVVGVVALVVKFITTYPPLMFCGRGALDGLYGELRKLTPEEFKSNERGRRIIISTLWFLSTVLLAVFAPDISVTLQLLGSMASINVFVFPGMCLISLTRRLRLARRALLLDETAQDFSSHQQRAKDYYLISGSYFGAMKKHHQAQLSRANNLSTSNHHHHNHQHNHHYQNHQLQYQSVNDSTSLNNRQHFSATFASLVEFERNASYNNSEYNGNGTNGTIKYQQRLKDQPSLDRSTRFTNNSQIQHQRHQNNQCQQQQQQQQLQNSWNNRSTTGSILDRLGSSIAPSTVAQIGISKCVATGLYLFAAFLILFGAFIFVLELVIVFGLI